MQIYSPIRTLYRNHRFVVDLMLFVCGIGYLLFTLWLLLGPTSLALSGQYFWSMGATVTADLMMFQYLFGVPLLLTSAIYYGYKGRFFHQELSSILAVFSLIAALVSVLVPASSLLVSLYDAPHMSGHADFIVALALGIFLMSSLFALKAVSRMRRTWNLISPFLGLTKGRLIR